MLNRKTKDRLDGGGNQTKDTPSNQIPFREFADQVDVGISVTDEQGLVVFWNAAMERITGLIAAEALSRFVWDVQYLFLPPALQTPDSLNRIRGMYLSFLASGNSKVQSQPMEFEYNQPEGSKLVLQGREYAIQTEKGYRLFNVLQDISQRHVAGEALKASEEKFRSVVEQARDGIVVFDAQEVVLEWNDGCEQIFGVPRENAIGMYITDLVPELFQGADWTVATPEATLHEQMLRYLNLISRTSLPRISEGQLRHSSGTRKWVQAVTFSIHAGDLTLFSMITRDVTLMKQTEERLQRYARQLDTLRQAGLEISAELGLDALIWMIAPRAIELLNGTAMALYLYDTENDLLQLALSLGDNQPELEKQVKRGYALAGQVWETGKSVLLEDYHTGRTSDLVRSYWGKVAATPIIWGGEFQGVVFVFSDQAFYESDLKILELFSTHAAAAIRNARLHQQLSQLAVTDSLTGIYNRRQFFELSEKEFHQAVRYKRPFSVVMFDLDLFKKVNDTLGHARGDEVLRMVVQRCSNVMRLVDIFGRYGGEEFVIALPETGPKDALALAERLCQELASGPVELEQIAPAMVTASFGVATLGPEITNLMELLNRADIALYHAKQAGRNQALLWDPSFHDSMSEANTEG